MLMSTIPYKDVFERLALRDIDFVQIMPSDDDWKKARSICNFLKPFYEGNINRIVVCRGWIRI